MLFSGPPVFFQLYELGPDPTFFPNLPFPLFVSKIRAFISASCTIYVAKVVKGRHAIPWKVLTLSKSTPHHTTTPTHKTGLTHKLALRNDTSAYLFFAGMYTFTTDRRYRWNHAWAISCAVLSFASVFAVPTTPFPPTPQSSLASSPWGDTCLCLDFLPRIAQHGTCSLLLCVCALPTLSNFTCSWPRQRDRCSA